MSRLPNTTCSVCGVAYHRSPSLVRKNIKLTCSRTCAGLLRNKGNWTNCLCCGTSFYRSKSLTERGFGKYCSRKCEAASRPNPPVECTCGYCGTKFMKDWWSVNKCINGGKFCSRSCIDKFKRKLRKRGEQEMFTQWQKREWLAKECVKCGSTTKLELDHKIPRFAGGKATFENAQTLCQPCNRRKFWTDDYPLYLELLIKRLKLED